MKQFIPEIKNPKAFYLHEAYGITEERRLALSKQMTDMHNALHGTVSPVYVYIDYLSKIADNAEEFAFCLFVETIFLVRNGFNLT